MSNLVVHFEIHASDPHRLMDFYSNLLGWTFTQYGDMDYWVIDTGEGSVQMEAAGHGINGGLMKREGPGPELGGPVTGANLVVGVDRTDEVFARGLALGGVEAIAPYDMVGLGRIAYLLDPDNNVFGLISSVLSDGTDAMAG